MISPLTFRDTYTYDLPLTVELSKLRPERAILRFANGKTVDVGALCYLNRGTSFRTLKNLDRSREVAIESFHAERVEKVRLLIQNISEDVAFSGRRIETIRTNVSRFMAFMTWADTNGWQSVLGGGPMAISAVKEYVSFIRDRVARNEISLNSGAAQQTVVVAMLSDFLNIEDLARGLYLLRKDPKLQQSTSPPSEDAQGMVLSLCDCIFQALSGLTLEHHNYPLSMSMPKYLGFPDDRLWVFPGTIWFKTPSTITSDVKWNVGNNYLMGRLATQAEVMQEAPDRRASKIVAQAKRHLAMANADAHHPSRRQAAITAMSVFTIMFVANTGMNWAQVTEMSWTDDYEVSATHQGFRSVKWRAGGKLVTFELPVAALPTFRRFLEIRRYLLRGEKCDFLFFSMESTRSCMAQPLRGRLNSTYETLRRMDPRLPKVMCRGWRAAKSDWLVRFTDPATAALVLQNTERTVLSSYAEGSEITQITEMGKFLDQVASTVLAKGQSIGGATQRTVGLCKSFGAPAPIPGPVSVTPDCRGVEGCLFCDEFKVHADEQDARKLLSCRHCLRRTAPLAGNQEQRERLVNPILKRIDAILAEIAKRDQDLIDRVTREVDDEGELDPYWALKLEMLMVLGVIS